MPVCHQLWVRTRSPPAIGRADRPLTRAADLIRRLTLDRVAHPPPAALFIQTAGQYGVNYVIWYGNIWQSRTGQWTAYNGGGVYDPGSITGGHYDHVHVSMFYGRLVVFC